MELKFNVHRANMTKVSKLWDMGDGQPISAEVHAFEVELVSTMDNCGSWIGRFVGKAADEAKTIFTQGEDIVLSVVPKQTTTVVS